MGAWGLTPGFHAIRPENGVRKVEATMIGRRTMSLSLTVVCIFGVVWYGGRRLAQQRAEILSLCNCEDTLEKWKTFLHGFADDHSGCLPTEQQRKAYDDLNYRIRHYRLNCDTEAPRVWNDSLRKPLAAHPVPLVWCGRPHGVTHQWRNVLFSDFRIERVDEHRFESLLAEAGIHP
jgi:hypothetical protein